MASVPWNSALGRARTRIAAQVAHATKRRNARLVTTGLASVVSIRARLLRRRERPLKGAGETLAGVYEKVVDPKFVTARGRILAAAAVTIKIAVARGTCI